jgi:tetratricopeptide (TPR) repeat protein
VGSEARRFGRDLKPVLETAEAGSWGMRDIIPFRAVFQNTRMLSGLLLLVWPASASPELIEKAEALYLDTEYRASLQVLAGDADPSAAVYLLMGKDYFMLQEYGTAAQLFEKVVGLRPQECNNELWLARAYGRRAETGTWLLAVPNASKARQHFEKAAALDPHNAEAMNDLFDYYLHAPGILGGGLEKAQSIADRIAVERPAESQFELAQIAERRKQYVQAEGHLREALELAPRQVGRVLDLARFLAKRGRLPESDALFAEAGRMGPDDPRVLFARAQTYIDQRRHPEEARRLLQRYLEVPLTPDDPPKSAAEKLLRQVAIQ